MTALTTAFLAATWHCTSPLTVAPDPALAPLSPVTLTLAATDQGTFDATGVIETGHGIHPVAWSGHWTLIDDGLAMIGRWQSGASTQEMRGFSTVLEPDVLLLDLSEPGHSGLTLRCLKELED